MQRNARSYMDIQIQSDLNKKKQKNTIKYVGGWTFLIITELNIPGSLKQIK